MTGKSIMRMQYMQCVTDLLVISRRAYTTTNYRNNTCLDDQLIQSVKLP